MSSKGKFNLRRLVVVVGVLAVVGLGAVWSVSWIATRMASDAWNAYYDELRASGEPLTLADIEKKRPHVAADENAAEILRQLEPLLEAIDPDGLGSVLYFSDDLETIDLEAGVPMDVFYEAQWFLENHADILTAAAPLANLSRGRLAVDFANAPDNPLDIVIPGLRSIQPLARLLQLQATIALIDGDNNAAAHAFRCMTNLGTSLGHEPVMVARVAQFDVIERSLETLESILLYSEPSAEQLVELITPLERASELPSLRFSLEYERAFFIDLCEGLIDGRVNFFADLGLPVPPKYIIRENELVGAKILGSLIDLLDNDVTSLQGYDQSASDIRAAAGVEAYTDRYRLVWTLVPCCGPVDVYIKRLAQLRCGRVAVMAALHRLKHASFPKSLADLDDPASELLIDPYDGNPFRFRAEGGSIVVYSIGPDLTDNQGAVQRMTGAKYAMDIGFRVYLSPRPVTILPSEDGDW